MGALALVLGLLLALLPGAQASAEPWSGLPPIIELREGTTCVDVLPYALAAEENEVSDAPARLSFKPDVGTFRTQGERLAHGELRSKAVWLCFTVRSAASSRTWLVSTGRDRLEDAKVYLVDPDGSIQVRGMDGSSSLSGGRHPFSLYSFPFTIGSGEVKTVYMRFQSEGLLRVRAAVWDSVSFMKAVEFAGIWIGVLAGVIAAVFLYTFLIAASFRDAVYAPYLLYLGGLLAFVLTSMGSSGPAPGLLGAWARNRAPYASSAVMAAGMLLFSRAFLDTKRRAPRLDALLLVGIAAVPVFLAFLAGGELRAVSRAGVVLDLAQRVFILAAAAMFALRRDRKALYFCVACAAALAGTVVDRLGWLGLLPAALEAQAAAGEEWGAFAQILVLSYCITDTINSARATRTAEQQLSIEMLERANKVKEDFFVGMGMEFRSPLYGMVGLVDAMDELLGRIGESGGAEEVAEAKRLALLVRAEAARLLKSVDNISTYSRLRNGDIVLTVERVALRDIVDGAVATASHMASGRDIVIASEVEDASIAADARAAGQIVYNLVADAIKRSPSGIVRAIGRVEGERALIIVEDSAPPLPEELLQRFRSGGGLSGPEAVGPGLELLVSRLLAERLGGSLAYEGREAGGRFVLALPLKRPASRAEERAEGGRIGAPLLARLASRLGGAPRVDLSETPPGEGRRGSILAYDKEPVFLEALKRYLEGRGYSVAPVVSAKKAFELASSRRFDLVLLDGDASGLEACARLRAVRPIDELPIIAMTDRESVEAVEAAFRAGASDYLPKLSPHELLFARVDTYVSLRRAVDEALETRRRVAELEKLKTLGVLSAGLAHEVNTPVNAVIRNLPVVSEVWREISPVLSKLSGEGFSVRGWTMSELVAELPPLLSDTYEAGLQIKKIVEDLKDYARDSSSVPPEAVDLSDVAAYAARLLAPLAVKSTRRFELELAEGLPPVLANYQKLTQVAINILENAFQSLPGPASGVWLRTRWEDASATVILECEDEGKGIPPSVRERIFEPFFTTKQDSGGTGLGLSVVLGIVRDAGGEIDVDSGQEGGTIVRVRLPVMKVEVRGGDGGEQG